jgi:hypothetical protein
MNYEIESYAGVGPIRLGMSREEVHWEMEIASLQIRTATN